MNEEQLIKEYNLIRRACKAGQTPTIAILKRLATWISFAHYEMFKKYKGGLTVEVPPTLFDFTTQTIQRLGIVCEIAWDQSPYFLLHPNHYVLVRLNRDGTKVERRYIEQDVRNPDILKLYRIIVGSDGVLYDQNLAVNYLTINRSEYNRHKALPWEVGEIQACVCCGNVFLKKDMVYNDIYEDYVDTICHEHSFKIKNQAPPRDDPISSYHSHRRTWQFIPQRVNSKDHGLAIGVELEMHSTKGNSITGAQNAARDILRETKENSPNYYFEWDGSLSEGGFEMITNPMSLNYGRDWWSNMLPIIRKSCVGYNVEKHLNSESDGGAQPGTAYNYGIHLTVSTKYLPHSVLPKLTKFFDFTENKEFLEAIAQRSIIYGGTRLGTIVKPKADDRLRWTKGQAKSFMSLDRRLPVNIKGKLVEFRMFRSTLNTISFLKNLEFLHAIITYYQETMTQSIHHRDFILWLSKNRKTYPNLILYLQHPIYFVKGVGKVKNVWLPLIKEVKPFKVRDVLEEYGPKPLYEDSADAIETSMVGA